MAVVPGNVARVSIFHLAGDGAKKCHRWRGFYLLYCGALDLVGGGSGGPDEIAPKTKRLNCNDVYRYKSW